MLNSIRQLPGDSAVIVWRFMQMLALLISLINILGRACNNIPSLSIRLTFEINDLNICQQIKSLLHFTSLHFTSLYVTLRHFTSLYVTLRRFTSLYVTLRHFTSLYVTLRHFTSLYVTLRHFIKTLEFLFFYLKFWRRIVFLAVFLHHHRCHNVFKTSIQFATFGSSSSRLPLPPFHHCSFTTSSPPSTPMIFKIIL